MENFICPIKDERKNKWLILSPIGKLTFRSQDPDYNDESVSVLKRIFEDYLADCQKTNNRPLVAINLLECNFVDANGLGQFVRILQTVNRQGGEFLIVDAKDAVAGMLELTRMRMIMKICSTEEFSTIVDTLNEVH